MHEEDEDEKHDEQYDADMAQAGTAIDIDHRLCVANNNSTCNRQCQRDSAEQPEQSQASRYNWLCIQAVLGTVKNSMSDFWNVDSWDKEFIHGSKET